MSGENRIKSLAKFANLPAMLRIALQAGARRVEFRFKNKKGFLGGLANFARDNDLASLFFRRHKATTKTFILGAKNRSLKELKQKRIPPLSPSNHNPRSINI